MPAFLRDTNNSRPKPGYEALFNWCLQLLEYGRHPGTDRSITFSPADLTLEFTETAFEGDATVTLTNLNGGYTLDTSEFPAGTNITGYTGQSGDTLHFSIPEAFEVSDFTLSASGSNSSNQAVLFFYAPSKVGQQRVVTCQYDMTSDSASASMTVHTPEGPNYGFISIHKEDRETGAALPGVRFRVCDAAGTVVAEGCTDETGVFTTGKLDLGDYTFQEVATVQGYLLNDIVYPISSPTAERPSPSQQPMIPGKVRSGSSSRMLLVQLLSTSPLFWKPRKTAVLYGKRSAQSRPARTDHWPLPISPPMTVRSTGSRGRPPSPGRCL